MGARTELAVASALIRAGWEVYLPLFAPHSRIDLVVSQGRSLHKVQCKTARLRKGVLSFPTCSNTPPVRKDYRGEVDLFGVYSADLDEVYLVPVEDTATRGCHLRLARARNGQMKGVRFAADYLVRGQAQTPGSRWPQREQGMPIQDYPGSAEGISSQGSRMEDQDPPPSDSDLKRARRAVGLTQEELWSRYFSLGGVAAPDEFEAYLEGVLTPEPHEYDVLVHALNERSMELGSSRRWPYSSED